MGTPGVGKSTFSRLLAERLGGKHLDVSKIAIEMKFVTSFDKERDTAVADLKRLSRVIRNEIESGDVDLVVEGHYSARVVPREHVSMVFVLRKEPKDLEKELRRRCYPERKIKENVCCEILDICLSDSVGEFGEGKCHEIDVTGKPVEEVVDEAMRTIGDDTLRRTAVVDWLSVVSAEDRLRYLTDG